MKTREEILRDADEVASAQRPHRIEIGGKGFFVARINGAMRDAIAKHTAEIRKLGKESLAESDLAAIGWCMEDGTPVFDDLLEGAMYFRNHDALLQKEIASAFVEVNNLSAEAAEKNSEASQS